MVVCAAEYGYWSCMCLRKQPRYRTVSISISAHPHFEWGWPNHGIHLFISLSLHGWSQRLCSYDLTTAYISLSLHARPGRARHAMPRQSTARHGTPRHGAITPCLSPFSAAGPCPAASQPPYRGSDGVRHHRFKSIAAKEFDANGIAAKIE